MPDLIRVLAVDDSALARNAYRLLLTEEDGFELIGTAPNAELARKRITQLDPDVVILDIEMPGENGLSLLAWLMEHFPVPVVVSSSYSTNGAEQTLQAFSLGAVEVVCKGGSGNHQGWSDDFATTLAQAVRAAAFAGKQIRFSSRRKSSPAALDRQTATPLWRAAQPIRRGNCVVIGASTGGTEALALLIKQMPADFPPTMIVQHMPGLYTATFARRLDGLGVVSVREAVDGDQIGPGQVLVAPGGFQLRMEVGATGPVARVSDEGPVNRHAPSVDVLFESAAKHYRSRAIGILLTGMGDDGAEGMVAIRSIGGFTIAQDESSSVVYGMPAEAARRGGASEISALDDVIDLTIRRLSRQAS